VAAAGDIDLSLYAAAESARVPARVIVDLIRLYSFDVDFQRDIHAGDRFEVYYEVLRSDGRQVQTGEILYARLTVGGRELPLYRFRHRDGDVEYYNDKGESARKALMKTPIDGARLSSGFGLRRHPILGYTKMHRGIDFAAPTGTPIMAAGDGQVELAGWNGAYGRYVRVRHNSEFRTAYAHMTRIAKSVRAGRRVKQGDIIGYVGTTGRSTGPHLHYEVLRGSKQVNPMGLKLPTGRTLSGAERTAFQKFKTTVETDYVAALPAPMRLARSE
jgi:murein DD-endopeptidase MepM/ murein hydrolase activator NlpD